jgi:hypothetical protein
MIWKELNVDSNINFTASEYANAHAMSRSV